MGRVVRVRCDRCGRRLTVGDVRSIADLTAALDAAGWRLGLCPACVGPAAVEEEAAADVRAEVAAGVR